MRPGDALARFAEAGENDILRLVSAAATGVSTAVFGELIAQGHSVRPAHVPVFTGLDAQGTNISTLAARAGISRQAMSGLVRDLEGEGYVQTAPDPDDRRALVVELTERGAEFCDTAVEVAMRQSSAWRARLGAARYDALIDDLRILGDEPRRQ
jgi:DNA-binding MarR family transcriptional regulator